MSLWFDLTDAGERAADLLSAVQQTTATGVLLRAGQVPTRNWPDRVRIGVLVDDPAQLELLDPSAQLVVVASGCDLPASVPPPWQRGLELVVHDGPSLAYAVEQLAASDLLVLDFTDETNIPLELVVAEAQADGPTVVKRVRDIADALVSSGVLQHGPDAVLLKLTDPGEAFAASGAMTARQAERVELVAAEVVEVRSIGLGMRGCVDTTDLFASDEGMVVGSTSGGGLVVCAEVHHLPYMNLRPFRVNAGAVHSYVWTPGDRTAYITDLRAGEPVLGVSSDGRTRPLVVGRVKIETRPLKLIRCVVDEIVLNTIVQDDWHVRLFGASGEVLNSTAVRAGTKMLAMLADPGRHVGIAVQESIVEV